MQNQTQCNLKGREKLFLLHLDQAASCCKAYPQPLTDVQTLLDSWDQERQQLEQGRAVPSCEVCWRRQQQGQVSERQLRGHQTHNQVQLFLDNTCQQMCSYCSPKFSSTWQNSIEQLGPFERISQSARANQIPVAMVTDHSKWLDQIDQYILSQPKDSVILQLLGGEPLMQYRNLEKLTALYSDSVAKITVTTNLNPPSNRFLVWLLDRVPPEKLHFNISIDATPQYNHVPRAGFDQQRFEQNFDLIQSHGIDFSLMAVVSVLSVFDLPNFAIWAGSNHTVYNHLNNPDCLDAAWIGQPFLSQIAERFQTPPPALFDNLVKANNSLVDVKLYEQYNYLTQYFERTGQNPRSIANDIWQQYWTWLEGKYQ